MQHKDEEEQILLEKLQKTAILRARASLSRDQMEVCQDLNQRAESINLKLACRLTDEVGSPEQSFVFNPNANKLESALKVCNDNYIYKQHLHLFARYTFLLTNFHSIYSIIL